MTFIGLDGHWATRSRFNQPAGDTYSDLLQRSIGRGIQFQSNFSGRILAR